MRERALYCTTTSGNQARLPPTYGPVVSSAWARAEAPDLAVRWKLCSVYATSSTTSGISNHGQMAWRRSLVSCGLGIASGED